MSALCACERSTRRKLAPIVVQRHPPSSSRTTPKSDSRITRRMDSSEMTETWASATRSRRYSRTLLYSCVITARMRTAMKLAWAGRISTATFGRNIRRSCVTCAQGTRKSLRTSTSSSPRKSCGNTRGQKQIALRSRLGSRDIQIANFANRDSTETTNCSCTFVTDTSVVICVTEPILANRGTSSTMATWRGTSTATTILEESISRASTIVRNTNRIVLNAVDAERQEEVGAAVVGTPMRKAHLQQHLHI
jgi:hypothetical protein